MLLEKRYQLIVAGLSALGIISIVVLGFLDKPWLAGGAMTGIAAILTYGRFTGNRSHGSKNKNNHEAPEADQHE